MKWFEALILGILQGLTEYLPVSSSGHLNIGQYLFGVNGEDALDFTIVVHVATVLSTCLILWKEIVWLFKDLFKWKWNDGTKYIVNILISMIPVGIVGLFFKDSIEAVTNYNIVGAATGNPLLVVGICLLVTATLLAFSYFAKPRQKEHISPLHAFVIGIAQAVAALPGLSRSGSTIATGLLLGNKKEKLAKFSFLMVIPPILGEALLDAKDLFFPSADEVAVATSSSTSTWVLIIGFIAAFITGCFACKWMINLVKKGKLVWFAVYCAIVGILAIVVPYIA
ncbi:MAG: undecaprenyl-diphosphate phosphatase [Bacteroidales bacterium]|nr:undecaprenyl-diphosphate phosphatase [Bacteroidales bacterium]